MILIIVNPISSIVRVVAMALVKLMSVMSVGLMAIWMGITLVGI
jgi:hypothetical protein